MVNTIIKKIRNLILECDLICILTIMNALKITRNSLRKSCAILNFSLQRLTSILVMQEVPDPVKFFVTRWSNDPWLQMAYSFVKTGGSGEAYDMIAEDIQGKVFFAGEVSIFVTVDYGYWEQFLMEDHLLLTSTINVEVIHKYSVI